MRCRDALSVGEAEVLAGRFKSVSARYYVLHDPDMLLDSSDNQQKKSTLNEECMR
jgi:hypothetical protein